MVLTFIMKSSHPLLMFRFITNRYFCYILVVRLKKKKTLETNLSQVTLKSKWWVIFIFFATFFL